MPSWRSASRTSPGAKGDGDGRSNALARACGDAMWTDDATSQGLGVELVSIAPGQAVLGMAVTAAMVNWHDTCHGGFINLLADTAFGYACNSRNQRMVAQYCTIAYLNPAQARRTADRACGRTPARKAARASTTYPVKREDGTAIAEFRGHARAVAGNILADGK